MNVSRTGFLIRAHLGLRRGPQGGQGCRDPVRGDVHPAHVGGAPRAPAASTHDAAHHGGPLRAGLLPQPASLQGETAGYQTAGIMCITLLNV